MRYLLILLCVVNMSAFANDGKLYRFKVDGRVQLKDHVPPALTKYGYEILNSSGVLIKVVPPAPTAAEIAAKEAAEKAAEERQKRIEEQRISDRKLLRLYAKPDDVRVAENRKLEDVNNYIDLQKRRIVSMNEKLESARSQAANQERRGQEVTAMLRVEIAELESAIDDSQNDIISRQHEMEVVHQQYEKQFQRVKVLQVYRPGVLPEDVDLGRVERAHLQVEMQKELGEQ